MVLLLSAVTTTEMVFLPTTRLRDPAPAMLAWGCDVVADTVMLDTEAPTEAV